MVYVSGQIPEMGSDIVASGQVGAVIGLAGAQARCRDLRRQCRLLAGQGARRVTSIVSLEFAKLTVYVNAVPGFAQISQVGNGASEVLLKVFGERGRACALGPRHGWAAAQCSGRDRCCRACAVRRKGRTAIVIGGSKGLGFGVAEALAREGAALS